MGPGPERPSDNRSFCSSSTETKKRRRSESEEAPAGPEADGDFGGGGSTVGLNQHLKWDQYKPDRWCTVFSSSFQTL